MTRQRNIFLMTTVVLGLTVGMSELHAQNAPKDFIVPELKGSPEELKKLEKVMPPRPQVKDQIDFPRVSGPKVKTKKKQATAKTTAKKKKTTQQVSTHRKTPQKLRIDGGRAYTYQKHRPADHHRIWRSQATTQPTYVFERKKVVEHSYQRPVQTQTYAHRTYRHVEAKKTCYMKVQTPATYKTITKQVLVRPAIDKRVVIPARYREVERRVMVHPERVKIVRHKARYGYVNERVLVKPERVHVRHHPAKVKHINEKVLLQPAQRRVHVTPPQYGYVKHRVQVASAQDYWRQYGYGGHCGTNPVYCRVQIPAQYADQTQRIMTRPAQKYVQNIPAKYQNIRRQVVVKPAYNERIVSPAVYKNVKRKVITSPAWQERIVMPAKYRIVRENILVQAKRHEVYREPAVYKAVTQKVLVKEGKTHYQRVHVKKGGC